MYLTQLADVCRKAGLKVVEVDGWKSRGHGGMRDEIRTLTFHHTAGPASGDYPSLRVVRDGRPGLDGPLAHLGVGREGTVYVIAAGLCWHAGQSRHVDYTNGYAIGVEAENTGTGQEWPKVQRDALRVLFAALAIEFKLGPVDVRGHKETCDPPGRKIDPHGIDMDTFRSGVAREMETLRASRDKPREDPRPVIKGYVRRGDKGNDVGDVQRALVKADLLLAREVDEDFGPKTERAVKAAQRRKGLDDDGIVGPKFCAAYGLRWVKA